MSVKRMKSGKWYASFRYLDFSGVRKQVKKEGFKTRHEALVWEQEEQRKREGSSNMTLKSLIEIYLSDVVHRVKELTYSEYSYHLKKYIVPYLGDLNIDEITPNTVRTYRTEMSNKFSRCVVKRSNTMLGMVMNFGTRFYNLKSNPVSLAGPLKFRDTLVQQTHSTLNFWTLEDYEECNVLI